MWLATNLVHTHQGSARPRACSFPTSPPRAQRHIIRIAIKMHIEFKRYDNVHEEAMSSNLPRNHLSSQIISVVLQLSAEIILLLLVEHARCNDL